MGLFDFLRGARSDRFARRATARLRTLGWSGAITYDRAHFKLDLEGGGRVSLSELFLATRTFPASERDGALGYALRPFVEPEAVQTYEEAAGDLLPVVLNRMHLESAKLVFGEASPNPPWRSLAGPLVVVAGLHRPRGVVYVGDEQLGMWDRSLDEVLERGARNLRARGANAFERREGGFFGSTYKDFYDPSRLLFPEMFEALPLRGDPVAIALWDSCVVATGSEEIEALNAMVAYAEWVFERLPKPIALTPLILRNGGWRLFEPQEDELAPVLALTVKQRLYDDLQQTERLQAHFDPEGRKLFVAPLENLWDGASLVTWAHWPSEKPTLLPRADVIGLLPPDGGRVFRRWEDVERVCGPFPAEDGVYPARHRAERWPDPDAWARLMSDFKAPERFAG